MRGVSAEHWAVWKSGQFVGDYRPNCRATIQRAVLKSYDGMWRSLTFGQDAWNKEIPNIVSVSIDQRLGTDAASMTMVIRNQLPINTSTNLDLTHDDLTPSASLGPSRRQLGDLGYPGYYTYNRGVTPVSRTRWGHGVDPDWSDELIPNRVIRTFQGYGTDGAAYPWNDTNLVLTGTWLIDSVKYDANGTITISARDFAKLLIEQHLYPPIIPLEDYPLSIYSDHYDTVLGETTTTTTTTTPGTEYIAPTEGTNIASFPSWTYNTSSAYWFSDKNNRSACGHNPSHAFDGDPSTYWLSVANNPGDATWAYEWIEADIGGEYFNRVKLKTKWGGYKVYLSIMQNGSWIGTSTIPYSAGSYGAPNGSAIPYVSSRNIPAGTDLWYTYELMYQYWGERIRLTFTNLANTTGCPTGVSVPHRVGVIEIQAMVYTAGTSATVDLTVTTEETIQTEDQVFVPGNIRDYTDIVKLFAAWAGFYWPDKTPLDWVIEHWSEFVDGRVWGDFEYSGAYPVEPAIIDASYWDNKSLMDGINQIKEILGFIFYIDASGGVVWRTPNIWRKGNFVSGYGYVDGEDTVETIDENDVLIDFGVTIDDVSLRSEIIIASTDQPDLAVSVTPGYAVGENTPEAGGLSDLRLLGGQQRVTIVPDYPFISEDEVIKFGYLTTLWMHWSYRKSKFRVPGIAAFEPDDQVRIFERTTSEAYVHYVTGVSSNMDLDNGTWFLDMDTHWLGEGPDEKWVIDYTDIAENSPALMAFLIASGRITDGDAEAAGVDINNLPVVEIPEIDWRSDPNPDIFPDIPPLGAFTQNYISEDDTTTGGDPSNPTAGSYEGARQYWGQHCTNIGNMSFDSSHNIQTHKKLIDAGVWHAFNYIVKDLSITVHSVGCYSCRSIVNSTKWSYHAWGLALDLNAGYNAGWGYYKRVQQGGLDLWYTKNGEYYGTNPPAADSQASSLASAVISRIKTGNGKTIFYWGGNWNSVKDYMHYEIHVTPADIDTGVYVDGQPIWNVVNRGAV